MTIEFMGNKNTHNASGGICNEYLLRDMSSIEEVLLFYTQKKEEFPEHHILFILDDFSQAYYTSGHSIDSNNLSNTDGLDISGLPAECFEDGEHIGYLTTLDEFFIRQHNYQNLIKNTTFEDACNRGITLMEEDVQYWLDDQQTPLSIFDNPISALLVPVKNSYETLYAFPNGYFSCDLSPAENFIVAKRFQEHYGFELIGVGASYLGFIKKNALTTEQTDSFYKDLLNLYHIKEEQKDNFDKIFYSIMSAQNIFLIKYTE